MVELINCTKFQISYYFLFFLNLADAARMCAFFHQVIYQMAGNSLYTSHSTHLTVHISLYTSHSTHLTLHISLYTSHYTHLTVHISLYTSHCTHLTVHISLYTSHYTHLTLHISLYTSHYHHKALGTTCHCTCCDWVSVGSAWPCHAAEQVHTSRESTVNYKRCYWCTDDFSSEVNLLV